MIHTTHKEDDKIDWSFPSEESWKEFYKKSRHLGRSVNFTLGTQSIKQGSLKLKPHEVIEVDKIVTSSILGVPVSSVNKTLIFMRP